MDTAGLVMVLIGIYLLTSAIKNRRPVELIKRIAASPGSAKSLTETAEGYTPLETGAPRLLTTGGTAPSGTETPTQSGDPSMSLTSGSTPAYMAAGNRPTNVKASTAAGVKPVTRAGLYSVARAFPSLTSFGGRAGRPGNYSDHPRGLAIDIMIPSYKSDSGRALGNRVADYFVQNADKLHVKYIIWNAKKWNPSVSRTWRAYRHPSGIMNDTTAHRNHVHVSFKG